MQRRAITIRGTVQGVGFRPFIYALATQLQLRGWVRNDAAGVEVEAEGDAAALEAFVARLASDAPPLARVDVVAWEPRAVAGDAAFAIVASVAGTGGAVRVSPDVATCDACLAELFDPRDRRYRHPFLNCTNCGPRLTIVTGAPYDRQRTTMAGFAMCPLCRAEYDDPGNRRFHAQPTACPTCGPRLAMADAGGEPIESADPVADFAQAIRAARIGAIKGIGGYHLACDAASDAAVAELRRRKRRDEKPFAVMVPDVAAAEALCHLSTAERDLLASPRRPVVLLARRSAGGLASAVAPGNPQLGVMLPYAPLHHLLLRELGRPIVMTSGNRSDEPIAIAEPDVFERLAGIADVFLTHNRPIYVRCDDSVTRVVGGRESIVRRSRGHAPQPIRLPVRSGAPGLAVGGQLKATFGLVRDDQATISHHLGDLDHFEAYRAFERDLALYERTFDVRPAWIAHDLHPDYASTRYALRRAAAEGLRAIAVQHHHAHLAACMAEHGLDEPVIGVCFDGTGFGTDGAVWGGEFLVGDYAGFRRAAHLRYVPMPGGDRAVREPWRMAVAHLHDAGVESPALAARVDPLALRTARRMIERRLNAPPTSSMGRLFDAVASLAGVRDEVTYEGQAAIELEWLAAGVPANGGYAFHLDADGTIDTRPLIRGVVADLGRGVPAAVVARRFHTTVVNLTIAGCEAIRSTGGLTKVVLSGGVFMNAILAREARDNLATNGFFVLRPLAFPANDGGISVGQLAVAVRQIQLS